jgi:cytoskeletal protein CcmA (bactofilin family)
VQILSANSAASQRLPMANSIDAALSAGEERVASHPAPSLAPSMTGDSCRALTPDTGARRATNHLLIDAGSSIAGNLIFDGDVILHGRFIGTMRCRSLVIDSGAILEAAVTARQVTIRGAASGSIESECVRIERTAIVDSEIRQKQFTRDEGARMDGALVEADQEVKAMQDTFKQSAASDRLMVRLAELREHHQTDLSHCPPLGK